MNINASDSKRLPEGYLRGFSIVVAHDEELGIGRDGMLPWSIPEDLKRFRTITTTSESSVYQPLVMMGMTTWKSLPKRPLPSRANAVLSRTRQDIPEVLTFTDFGRALDVLCRTQRCGSIYVIGGASVYEEAVRHPALTGIYVTEVAGTHGCDRFFPEYRDIEGLSEEYDPRNRFMASGDGKERYKFRYYKKEG